MGGNALRYRLARFNPKEDVAGGLALIGLQANCIKESRDSRYGAILVKPRRLWLKNFINTRLTRGWNYSTQTFGGQTEWNYSIRGSLTLKACTFIAKESGALMESGIVHNKTFLTRRVRKRNLAS